MYKIIKKVQFSEKVFRLDVEAPLIAKARKAGHFVIIRVGEKGERVPLTLPEVTQRREPLRWLFKPLEQVPISFVP